MIDCSRVSVLLKGVSLLKFPSIFDCACADMCSLI